MPKLKTVKGVKGRIRITRTGKLICSRAGRRHLLHGKRSTIKRHLRKKSALKLVDARNIRLLMPY